MDTEIGELDDVVREMLREDLPAQLASFRDALARNDFALAASEVHAICGSAAFCKLELLRESAAVLEQSLKKNDRNADMIRAFESQVNAVLHLLYHQST